MDSATDFAAQVVAMGIDPTGRPHLLFGAFFIFSYAEPLGDVQGHLFP
ncbi:MAG TPA: hypothetical protein VF923_00790 [Gemmatimonadales bacterium]